MKAGALTVVADVKKGQYDALKKRLLDHDEHGELGFPRTKTVHFGRFVLLPPFEPGVTPDLLAIETNYDGPEDAHLDDLVATMGEPLREVLAHCVAFDGTDDATTKAWLERRRVDTQAFYVGAQGFSRERIEKNRAIRDAIADALDDARAEDPKFVQRPGPEIHAEIRRRVTAAHPELQLETDEPVIAQWGDLARELLPYSVPLVGAAAALAVVGVPYLFFKEVVDALTEQKPHAVDDHANDDRMTQILATEDWRPQNPLTILSRVKPGPFRWMVIRAVLWGIHRLARHWYRFGHLGDMWAIHFARWTLLPDGRLLFFSNYDGSWESYLGDFVDKASKGLTSIWSHTVGYPRTFLLVLGGAKDEETFKAWVRSQQHPTQLWFTAYPDRSVPNVFNDQALVRGLTTSASDEIDAFLRRL